MLCRRFQALYNIGRVAPFTILPFLSHDMSPAIHSITAHKVQQPADLRPDSPSLQQNVRSGRPITVIVCRLFVLIGRTGHVPLVTSHTDAHTEFLKCTEDVVNCCASGWRIVSLASTDAVYLSYYLLTLTE